MNRLLALPSSTPPLRILPYLMAFAAIGHFNRISMSVAGTERLMGEFSLTDRQMGIVYSAYLLVYTIFMIPGGWLIDRYGPAAALSFMGLASAALVAATALPGLAVIPHPWVLPALILVRGSLGLVSVPLHPSAARVVSLSFPPGTQSAANGWVTGAALVGIAFTYPIFGWLIDYVGWRTAFLVTGAGTLGLTAAWVFFVARTDGNGTPDSFGTSRGMPTTTTDVPSKPIHVWNLAFLTASYAAVGYFQYLFFYWIEFYFEKVLLLGTQYSRSCAMASSLSMAVGMVAGGRLTRSLQDRWGYWRGLRIVPIGGMLGGAVLTLGGVLSDDPLGIAIWFSLAMAAVGMAEGAFWTAATEVGGTRGGLSAAIFNTGGNAGGVLAPVVTPYFSHYFGWQAGIALASGVCVVGALLWLLMKPIREREVRRSRA